MRSLIMKLHSRGKIPLCAATRAFVNTVVGQFSGTVRQAPASRASTLRASTDNGAILQRFCNLLGEEGLVDKRWMAEHKKGTYTSVFANNYKAQCNRPLATFVRKTCEDLWSGFKNPLPH